MPPMATSGRGAEMRATSASCARPLAPYAESFEVVRPRDRVYVLGDFAWKSPRELLGWLNGHKILIIGNHDYKSPGDSGEPFFDAYHNLLDIVIDEQPITLCHYPMKSWNKSSLELCAIGIRKTPLK